MRARQSAMRWWASPEFVEHHVLPLVAAFALGVVGTLLATEAARDEAAEAERAARAELSVWRNACEPLLSAPVRTAPLVIRTAAGPRYCPRPEPRR